MTAKKLKLFQVVNEGSVSIANLKKCKALKGSTTLKIRRIVKPFLDEIKSYEELRNEKINSLGSDDPQNPSQKIILKSSPNFDTFIAEITEILSSDVEIEVKTPLDISEFEVEAELGLSDEDFDVLIDLGIITDSSVVEEAPKAKEEVVEAEVVQE